MLKDIIDDLYAICIKNLKCKGVYSYLDIDLQNLIKSKLIDCNINDALKAYLISNINNLEGVYSYLHSINCLDVDNMDFKGLLEVYIEDTLSNKFILDGFKLCIKSSLFDYDISIFDGDVLIYLNKDNVFDRLILNVLETIPYDIIYIK